MFSKATFKNSIKPSSSSQESLSMTRPSVLRCSCLASLGLISCPRATLYGGSVTTISMVVSLQSFSTSWRLVLSPTINRCLPSIQICPFLVVGSSGISGSKLSSSAICSSKVSVSNPNGSISKSMLSSSSSSNCKASRSHCAASATLLSANR